MDVPSLGAAFFRSAETYSAKVAMRKPVKGGFEDITYADLLGKVCRYASTFHALGLKSGDRIAILAENSPEWAIVDWACQCLGIVLVPIYPTLPVEQVAYIVNDSGATLVLAGDSSQASKTESMSTVRTLLLMDTFQDLVSEHGAALSKEQVKERALSVGEEDLATIIYTSGTTGNPKGVMLPHRALLHVCKSVRKQVPIDHQDTFFTFLPMSHVYERIAGQHFPIYLGATIGYAHGLAAIANDLLEIRPTVMLCVPRFLAAFRDRILDGVSKAPPVRQRLFHMALSQGVKKSRGEFAPLAGLLDKIVCSKVRERVGGRMRFFVSGGAALPPDVAEFYMALGLTVLQGYGLTETAGGSFINVPSNNKYWTVGEAVDMEVKIADDGEILMRGRGLMLGYYNLPEATKEAVDSDGWFHTGDIGEFEGKNLKITDRKKDILVLGNGKNVAPQPVENKLKGSPFLTEAVLFGDGMEHCVALVIPNHAAVRKELNITEGEPLANREDVKTLIKSEVSRINKTLAGFEMVKGHAILEQPFTVEAGELTPTLKVKRKFVKQKYADHLSKLGVPS